MQDNKKKMKRLLDKENYDDSYSIAFLRDSGLVDYHTCTYYVYENRYGDYIGNDSTDDSDELLDNILEDQDYDEFLEEYLDKYVDEDDLESYYEQGLSNREIAEIILNKE